MYRTVTDLEYSRPPNAPSLSTNHQWPTFVAASTDTKKKKIYSQPTLRLESGSWSLVERKGLTPNGTLPVAVYPYSMDFDRIVDGLREPSRSFEYFSAGEPDYGSGAMSMD